MDGTSDSNAGFNFSDWEKALPVTEPQGESRRACVLGGGGCAGVQMSSVLATLNLSPGERSGLDRQEGEASDWQNR